MRPVSGARLIVGAVCVAAPGAVLTAVGAPDRQEARVRLLCRVLGARLLAQGAADLALGARTRTLDVAVDATHAATMVAAAARWPGHRRSALASGAFATATAALDAVAAARTDAAQTPRTPSGLASRLVRTRWVVRAPIALYRWRLGGLFGGRLLMLEHRGRTSGLARYVVLEVVDRTDHASWVVVSGFGEHAQWLRNVRADPHVRVWSGSRRPVLAVAHELPAPDRAQVLRSYAARHPRAWHRLRPVLERTLGAPVDDDGANLPMVVLERALVG